MEIRERPCETQNWVSLSLLCSKGQLDGTLKSVCKSLDDCQLNKLPQWIHTTSTTITRSLLF
jgi:hypothetical protein